MGSKVQAEPTLKAPLPAVVAATSKMLAKMQAKPKSGWTIENVQTACSQLGLTCRAPKRGTHYTISSNFLDGVLTIPYNRPIKLFYIKCFISLAEAHVEMTAKAGGKNG